MDKPPFPNSGVKAPQSRLNGCETPTADQTDLLPTKVDFTKVFYSALHERWQQNTSLQISISTRCRLI